MMAHRFRRLQVVHVVVVGSNDIVFCSLSLMLLPHLLRRRRTIRVGVSIRWTARCRIAGTFQSNFRRRQQREV